MTHPPNDGYASGARVGRDGSGSKVDGWVSGVGADYVCIDYGAQGLYLLQIAHVRHIQHNPRECDACYTF